MKIYSSLAMLFITLFIVVNLISQKLVHCGGLLLTAGDLIFPFIYLLSVILTEVYGYRQSRVTIWTAFSCNLIASVIIWLAILLPFDADLWSEQVAFSSILGKTPRFLLASFIAFLSGELVCARLLHILQDKFSLKVRCSFATFCGHVVDSLFFSCIAFWGVTTSTEIIYLTLSTTSLKILEQTCLLPVANRVIKSLRTYEQLN